MSTLDPIRGRRIPDDIASDLHLSVENLGLRGVTATTGRLHLYVSDINGDDANTGFFSNFPVKTLSAAFALIPTLVRHPVFVHVGNHGGSGYAFPSLLNRILHSSIYIIGDGALQLNETGRSDVVATGVAAASTTANVVKTSGATINAYRGKTIEILSGLAAGDHRTVRDNSATDIVPVFPFSAAVAQNDTYRIYDPSVVFALPDASASVPTPSIVNCGGSSSIFPSAQGAGVYFINIDIDGNDTGDLAVVGSRVIFLGVTSRGVGANGARPAPSADKSFFGCGLDISDASGAGVQGPVLDGLGPSLISQWRGWGLSYQTGGVFRLTVSGHSALRGYLVAPAVFIARNSAFSLDGGNLYGTTTGAVPTIDLESAASAAFVGTVNTPILVSAAAVLGCIRVRTAGVISSLIQTILSNTSGPALNAQDGGLISGIATTCTGSGSTFGSLARFGGRISWGGAPQLTGTTADISVDGATGVMNATLNAVGTAQLSGVDGSCVQRVA